MSKLVLVAWCLLALVLMSALFTETKPVFYKRLLIFMLLLAMSFTAGWLYVPLMLAFIAIITIINLQNNPQMNRQNQFDSNSVSSAKTIEIKQSISGQIFLTCLILLLLIGWFGFLLVDAVDTFKLLTIDTKSHESGWLDLWSELRFHWSTLLWPLISLSGLVVLSIHYWFSNLNQGAEK